MEDIKQALHELNNLLEKYKVMNIDDYYGYLEIDMTENRLSNISEGIVGNFEKADTECAKKWNAEGKDGKTDWTARDVADYRRDHNMTWHECADRKTCQMISRDIHDYFGHSGGVCECKKVLGQSFGGGFDA